MKSKLNKSESNEKLKMNDNFNSQELNKDSYIEIIEKKIRDQAQRLIELQAYKSLCETKIKQFIPNQNFPLTEECLKENERPIKQQDNNEIISLKKQINEMKIILGQKDQEIMEKMRKIDTLTILNNQKGKINNNSNKNSRKVSPNQTYQFDQLNNEITPINLNSAYTNLQNKSKEMNQEKERILDSLRKETLINEEQRNYIEILKQTIESTINKLGIGPLIQQQSNNNFPGRNVCVIDFLVDFTQLKSEGENYRKELVKSNILINELRNEIDYLNKINDDMQIKKEKIIETVEAGINELEEAKGKVSNLEREKEYLNQDVETLKIEYEKTINDYNNLVSEFEKLKEENIRKSEKYSHLEKDLENQNILQKKISDHRNNYERINLEYKNLKKLSEEIEKDNNDLIQQMRFIKEEKINLINEHEERINSLKKEKDSLYSNLENINNQYKLLERKFNDALNNIKDKSSENKRLEEKLTGLDQNYSREKRLNETLNYEFVEAKRKTDTRLHDVENTINELSCQNDELKRELLSKKDENNLIRDNFEKEIVNKTKEINQIYNELQRLTEINNNCNQELNKKDKNITKMNEKISHMKNQIEIISTLNKKIDDLQRETENQLKERNHFRNLVKRLEDEIESVKENNMQKEEIIMEKNKFLTNCQNGNKELKLELQDICNKYSIIKNELQNSLKHNYEIENKLNKYVKRKDELENKLLELENETTRIEKMRKKLLNDESSKVEEISRFTNQQKNFKLNNNIHDVLISIHSCLSFAKSFMKKISKNKNLSEIDKFSLASVSDDNPINLLKSLEDWIKIVCNELEKCYDTKQESNILPKEINNYEIKNLHIQINNLIQDNQILSRDNETLTRKNENLKEVLRSKETEINFSIEKDSEKKTLNELSYQIQSLEEIINNLTKERKSVELLVIKLSAFLKNKDIALLVKDFLSTNELVFQIQRDKIKLTQRLNELDYEKRINEFDKNILIEIENIGDLLKEYEIRYNNKKDELKNIEFELNKLESIEKKNKYDTEQTNSSTFQRKFETKEIVQKQSITNLSEFNKFDRNSKTKEIDVLSKQNFIDKNDNFSKGVDRLEFVPTSDSKFRRIKNVDSEN